MFKSEECTLSKQLMTTQKNHKYLNNASFTTHKNDIIDIKMRLLILSNNAHNSNIFVENSEKSATIIGMNVQQLGKIVRYKNK